MPKESRTKHSQHKQDDILSKRSNKSLGKVMHEDETIKKYGSVKTTSSKYKKQRQEMLDQEYMDEKTSKRILELSREQLLEEEKNDIAEEYQEFDSEEEDVVIEEDDDDSIGVVNRDEGYVTVNESNMLSKEEEELVNSMMGGQRLEERRTLADIILAKIEEKEMMQQQGEEQQEVEGGLPDKVVQVYTEIGVILKSYTSGKLPKAFKIIPSLSNWEDILYLTRPDLWTPQAMYAATRIFASNLNPKMAQRFFNLILLDAIRADIHVNQSLNYHYYQSLLKAAYKPSAFFKGIILPLARPDAMCTLREGLIIASALKRLSIPVHHSAVAIIKLATGTYTPSASIFLRELLNKKYSLPASVIQTIVMDHFAKFIDYKMPKDQPLPVLWHQSLLVFVQRYKEEIKSHEEYKETLKTVIKVHFHPKITREVRRELFEGAAWSEERNMMSGDSTVDPMDM